MNYIYPCIEQLDLAATQLHIKTPSYARFAFIMTDNIIELMLHKQCTIELRWNDIFRTLGRPPKYDLKYCNTVLGQHFTEKVKFCKKIGRIDIAEADFILNCHLYRNELYHTGIRHESIIYPLAWYYHELACNMFGRLEPEYYMWRSEPKPSEIVIRHLGDIKFFTGDVTSQYKASISLNSSRPKIDSPLCIYLAECAVDKLMSIEDNLDFLVKDHPNFHTEADIIHKMQVFNFVNSPESRNKLKGQTEDDLNNVFVRFRLALEQYIPRYRANPIPKWKKRADLIKKEVNQAKALSKFNQFRRDIDYFEKIMEDAAVSLDEYIQGEIDRARGK